MDMGVYFPHIHSREYHMIYIVTIILLVHTLQLYKIIKQNQSLGRNDAKIYAQLNKIIVAMEKNT
jgi:hypothetical protein